MANATTVDDAENESKQSALHWACASGRLEFIALLVGKGAQVEKRDATGCTPLMHAVQQGHCLATHYMLSQAQADAGCVDDEGHTILMWAIYRGGFKLVWYLLENCHHLDVNAKDKKGATALHWSAIRKQAKLVPLLLAHGASVEATGPEGKRPLEVARDVNAMDCVTELSLQQRRPTRSPPLLFWLWTASVPTLFVLLWVHWVLLVVAVLGLFLYIQGNSEVMNRHMMGANGFRSDVPYAIMWSTSVVMYYYSSTCFLTAGFTASTLLFHLCMVCMFVGLYFTRTLGPGLCDDAAGGVVDWSLLREEQFCPFCVIQMPARSHHCARCNGCVAKFDHHCPWVDSCIGYKNNHHFFYMCLGAALAHTILLWQGWKFLELVWDQSSSVSSFLDDWMVLAAFFVFSFIQGLGEWAITLAQLFAAIRDSTTMEHGRRHYDRGILTNLRQFFHIAGPLQIDWTREYKSISGGNSAQEHGHNHDHGGGHSHDHGGGHSHDHDHSHV